MKKIQKRYLFLPIFLLFTSILFTACNTSNPPANDTNSENTTLEQIQQTTQNKPSENDTISKTTISYLQAKQELLNHWITLFDSMETLYSQMHLVFDYTEAFTTDNTWDSLLKARNTCSTIKTNLEKIPIPKFTITKEQYGLLETNGIKVDSVEYEYLDFTTEVNLQLDKLTTLEALLHNDIFFSSNVSVLDDWITTNRNLLTDTSEYFCLLTNYLLLQLEETAFWEQIPEKYPYMSMGYTTWTEDFVSLTQNSTLILDRYENRFVELEKILGTANYTLLLVEEALETGNLDHLIHEMHTISNVTAYLPEPEWFSDKTIYYYLITDAETQEKRMIQTKAEFSQTPSGCLITTPNIPKEEVEAYGNCLKEWGLEPTIQWNEETQTYEIFTIIGECQILATWTSEETTFYLTEPIPCLIPELYLVALLNK